MLHVHVVYQMVTHCTHAYPGAISNEDEMPKLHQHCNCIQLLPWKLCKTKEMSSSRYLILYVYLDPDYPDPICCQLYLFTE